MKLVSLRYASLFSKESQKDFSKERNERKASINSEHNLLKIVAEDILNQLDFSDVQTYNRVQNYVSDKIKVGDKVLVFGKFGKVVEVNPTYLKVMIGSKVIPIWRIEVSK